MVSPLKLITLSLYVTSVRTLTVYDCMDSNATHTTIDLLSPGECPDPRKDFEEPRLVPVAVLVSDDDYLVHAIQCQIRLTTKNTRCGFNGLTYMSEFTRWENSMALTDTQCNQAALGQGITVQGHHWETEIPMNAKHTFFSQGKINAAGNCVDTADYVVDGRHFENSVEESVVHISIKPISASINSAEETITFKRSGLKANVNDFTLLDAHEGRITWPTEIPSCNQTTSLVYNGTAKIHLRKKNDNAEGSIVMVENKETNQYAGFLLKKQKKLCGTSCYLTQIPSVTLCFPDPYTPLKLTFQKHVDPTITNMLTQMSYLHLGTNLRVGKRFETVQQDICKLERAIMSTKLQVIAGSANPYALLDTYGKGHQAIAAGTAAYITKCVPKEAVRKEYHNCTEEIPVQVEGVTRFADPFTWTLRDYPTVVPCSSLMPVRWRIQDKWYCASPHLQECTAPNKIQMRTSAFEPLGDFTEGLGDGIYTPNQLLQHRIFRATHDSRGAVDSKATNAAVINAMDGNLGSPFDKKDMDDIMAHVGLRFIPFFGVVGDLWTTVLWIFLAYYFFAAISNFGQRIYQVFRLKGCGWWLFFALSNAATAMILAPVNLAKAAVEIALHDLNHKIPGRRDDDDSSDGSEETQVKESVGSRPKTKTSTTAVNTNEGNVYQAVSQQVQEEVGVANAQAARSAANAAANAAASAANSAMDAAAGAAAIIANRGSSAPPPAYYPHSAASFPTDGH